MKTSTGTARSSVKVQQSINSTGSASGSDDSEDDGPPVRMEDVFTAIELDSELPRGINTTHLRQLNDVQMSPLIAACAFGRPFQVAHLLKRKALANTPAPLTQNTALHVAASKGSLECVDTLLAAKACISTANNEGFNPLHMAAMNGHRNVVHSLLQSLKSDVQNTIRIGDLTGMTPLHWASKLGYEDVCRVFLDFQADPHQVDKNGRNPLWHARDQENCSLYLEKVVDKQRDIITAAKSNDVNAVVAILKDFEGMPQMEVDDWTVVQEELEQKPVGDGQEGKGGAYWIKEQEELELVLQHVARRFSDDSIKSFKTASVPAILTEALSWNAQLMQAIVGSKWTAVTEIINKAACVNYVDSSGRTPLHYACQEGPVDCVIHLIERHADLHFRDSQGWSPLLFAAYYTRYSVVAELIGRQANPLIASFDCLRPVQVAIQRNDSALLALLYTPAEATFEETDPAKYGLDPTRFGKVPHHFLEAVYHGAPDVIYYALSYRTRGLQTQMDSAALFHAAILLNQLHVAETLLVRTQFANNVDWEKVFVDRPPGVQMEAKKKAAPVRTPEVELGAVVPGKKRRGSVSGNEVARAPTPAEEPQVKVADCWDALRRLRADLEFLATRGIYEKFNPEVVSVMLMEPITVEATQLLLKHGASHGYSEEVTKKSPLMAQVALGKIFNVEALLAANADPRRVDASGKAALDYASEGDDIHQYLTSVLAVPLAEVVGREEPTVLRLDGLPDLEGDRLTKWVTNSIRRYDKEVSIEVPLDIFNHPKGYAFIGSDDESVLRKLKKIFDGYRLYEELDIAYENKSLLVKDVVIVSSNMSVRNMSSKGKAARLGLKVGWILNKVNAKTIKPPAASISEALRSVGANERCNAQFRGTKLLANLQAVVEKRRV